MAALYVLLESPLGYSLFHLHGLDKVEPGNGPAVQLSALDLNRFQQVVKLVAFSTFQSTHDALTQYNAFAEGTTVHYIELERKFHCRRDEFVNDILRGVRFNLDKFIKDLKAGDLEKAQLDLGRSYSQAKVEGVAPDVMTSALVKKDVDVDVDANAPEGPTTEEEKKKENRKLVDKATGNVKVVSGLDGEDGITKKKRKKEE